MNYMHADKDEYIEYLENKIIEMSKSNNNNNQNKEININSILKYQEEFLLQKYLDKDWWIHENKTLHDENVRLLKTIMFDQAYINYLLDSYWWKATFPFRFISRKIKGKSFSNKKYVNIITPDSKINTLDIKVSVVIFTKNAGEEFKVQLNNVKKQEHIKEIEVIVVDRGSSDNTLSIAKEQNVKIIQIEDMNLSNAKTYLEILPTISGDYIIVIDQNKIVNSKYWMYQSIKPIYDGEASFTAFFKNDVSTVKETSACEDLKNRMAKIADQQVIFFPLNRNIIQYISPFILDKADVIIKKNTSDMEIEGVL